MSIQAEILNRVTHLCPDISVNKLELLGDEVHGEFAGHVEIKFLTTISDDGKGFLTGYAIGHNPNAVSSWVCWQFAVRDGVRHYNWGIYSENEQDVIDAYIARIFTALN